MVVRTGGQYGGTTGPFDGNTWGVWGKTAQVRRAKEMSVEVRWDLPRACKVTEAAAQGSAGDLLKEVTPEEG